MFRRSFVALTLAACLVSFGAYCTSNSRADPPTTGVAKSPTPAKESAPELSEAAFVHRLPGVDPSGLDGAQRAALVEVAEDVICDCGRPTTLAGCLKDQPDCRLAVNMTSLARWLLHNGAKPLEAADMLESYYSAFPKKRRQQFDIDAAACKGPPDAPVTIVEFADFECPYCGVAWPIIEAAVAASGGRVRLCFWHYPLSQHQNAQLAAQLSELAKEKGKFWDAVATLFANQHALERENLLDYAVEVGLDRAEVSDALVNGTYAEAVEAQRARGEKAGVEGTPTLFLNGRQFSLPIHIDGALSRAIADELAWIDMGESWTQE